MSGSGILSPRLSIYRRPSPVLRTSHLELAMLRKGAIRTQPVPPRKPAAGALKGKPPVTPGRTISLYAPQTRNPDGTTDRQRQTLRVLVLDAVDHGDTWMVTVRAGHGEDQGVYLAARPGTQRQDYVLDPVRALRDEPEVMGEDAADILARMAGVERQRRPDTRPWRTN